MQYISHYESPLGDILLAADEAGLTGLWFEGQKYFPSQLEAEQRELPIFRDVKHWLDLYFSGQNPDFMPPLPPQHPCGTPFQLEVWQLLSAIPHGSTSTYGEIAHVLAQRRGCGSISAQAVGRAVGRNPISILVPCHRVVGASGSLTGYAGGIERKIALLRLEGAEMRGLFVPEHSTAP